MQSNAFNVQAGGSATLPCSGTMVAYESGQSTTGNNYIIIRGDGQSEMRLKPGQSFTGTVSSGTWYIKADDTTAAIVGRVIIGDGEFHDSAINATIAGAVTVTSGNMNVTSASTTVNTNAQAIPVQKQALSNLTEIAPVTVGTAPALMFSDATQRILRIRNAHATATLYIGGPAVTTTQAAIVLKPGDLWIEEEAAGAAWWAVSDTANTPVNIQGVK